MKEINLEQYRMPPVEIAKTMKSEFTLEDDVEAIHHKIYGCTNPNLTDKPLFILGKKGKAHTWAYVEQDSKNHHSFLLLGNPMEWIKIQQKRKHIGIGYREHIRHNAHVELMFSTTKLMGYNEETPFCNWHMNYYPFTEILTPDGDGRDVKDYAFLNLSGQGNGKTTFWDNNLMYMGDHLPNPLSYVGPEGMIYFFKDIIADLHEASPTSAEFVKEKFPILK